MIERIFPSEMQYFGFEQRGSTYKQCKRLHSSNVIVWMIKPMRNIETLTDSQQVFIVNKHF